MPRWTIKAYQLASGVCPIKDWYRGQDAEVQAAFDATLTTLAATSDWLDTWQFKVLTRRHIGLGEIRFKLEGPPIRRFRPVGVWPPLVQREFIMLLGCEKRGNIYIPDDAFAVALDYRRRLEANEGEVHDYV